ncbi:hypothetical protein BaRGS_00024866 [Batillaria attramentaria]|uniref:Uncharacterized protein n=1 Tax=Batillaria attramentaria TaxID=370345 RepID=A0ABD0KA84_9CAEN
MRFLDYEILPDTGLWVQVCERTPSQQEARAVRDIHVAQAPCLMDARERIGEGSDYGQVLHVTFNDPENVCCCDVDVHHVTVWAERREDYDVR